MEGNFFEIHKQFGHEPSKRFASPSLDCWTLRNRVLWFFKNTQTTSPVTQHYIPQSQHWMMFTNILTFILDRSYCLCLLRAAQADEQRHIKKHTIWQLTNELSESSQVPISRNIVEKKTDIHWHQLIEPKFWSTHTHTHTATSQTH